MAGRPFPVLSEDDVIDYQIIEAIAVKARKEDEEAQKQEKHKEWRHDKAGFDRLRELSQGG